MEFWGGVVPRIKYFACYSLNFLRNMVFCDFGNFEDCFYRSPVGDILAAPV